MNCSKFLKRTLSYVLSATLIVSGLLGCASAATTTTTAATAAASILQGSYKTEDTHAEWSASEVVEITLNGDRATSSSAEGVSIDGSIVTITTAGTYVLSGSLTDGQIIVNATADDLVRLVLNGVNITCSDSAAIYAQKADKTIIILADGTQNTVTDGTQYVYASETDDEPNAAIFAKNDLSFTGTGSLTVNAQYHNGIGTKDDLVIVSGTYQITAVNHGLLGKDSVSIADGTFTIDAGADGIQSSVTDDAEKGWIALDGGSYTITAANDAIQAETELIVNGGVYTLTTGGGSAEAPAQTAQQVGGGMGGGMRGGMSDGAQMPPQDGQTPPASADTTDTSTTSDSYKALKSGTYLTIAGGTFTIDAQDDALHTGGSMDITGGTLTIASGDDALHADQTLTVADGNINISTCYEGLEALKILMSGGTVNLTASDDGVNASDGSAQNTFGNPNPDCNITISGGSLTVNASGDGLDSNGDLTISGGTVTVHGSVSSGESALDYDGTCTISQGTLIAAGFSGMAQTPASTSTQPSLSVTFDSAQAAGTVVTLLDSSGQTVLTYTAEKSFQHMILSSAGLKQGAAYTLTAAGQTLTTVTLNNMVTNISQSGTELTGRSGGFDRQSREPANTVQAVPAS